MANKLSLTICWDLAESVINLCVEHGQQGPSAAKTVPSPKALQKGSSETADVVPLVSKKLLPEFRTHTPVPESKRHERRPATNQPEHRRYLETQQESSGLHDPIPRWTGTLNVACPCHRTGTLASISILKGR